uniref:glutamine synthetase beta-grasp domain-containing protein n=1 Tax=Candidatus Planktophila sp. TaxID=2175601 RepID=UPI00404B22D9
MFKNSAEIFAFIKKEDIKLIDVRFTDLPGIQHHFNVPVESFDEAVFTDGLMFDGSSIRGFQSIHESDMKLLPIPSSAFIDPFRLEKTLVILFSVHNPSDNTPYSRDPRGVVAKAVDYLKSTGIADQAFFAGGGLDLCSMQVGHDVAERSAARDGEHAPLEVARGSDGVVVGRHVHAVAQRGRDEGCHDLVRPALLHHLRHGPVRGQNLRTKRSAGAPPGAAGGGRRAHRHVDLAGGERGGHAGGAA